MTEAKSNKIAPQNPSKKLEAAPPRKSFSEMEQGELSIVKSALRPDRAYRWCWMEHRNDYKTNYDYGYRETLLSDLNGSVSSDSNEKVIRKTKTGTFVLMDAPIEYRQQTNDEIAQLSEQQLRQMMGDRSQFKNVNGELHLGDLPR